MDAAVMELIYEGERKGLWEFKTVHTVPKMPCDYDLHEALQREHCKEEISDYEKRR